ncbi:hypothetical protein EVAR_86223_1 [Eumeta japonica]|uniref:Uncharacterized protein n=1 Tax=Eumeta variegata TaxID=151549 RepID=A0A4C1UD25_EUMVA|nr:hypothetical protein EVAR_86223_1 [Eumeta japonica]
MSHEPVLCSDISQRLQRRTLSIRVSGYLQHISQGDVPVQLAKCDRKLCVEDSLFENMKIKTCEWEFSSSIGGNIRGCQNWYFVRLTRRIVISSLNPRLKDTIVGSASFNKFQPNNGLNLSVMGINGQSRKIFGSEHLSPDQKHLHYSALPVVDRVCILNKHHLAYLIDYPQPMLDKSLKHSRDLHVNSLDWTKTLAALDIAELETFTSRLYSVSVVPRWSRRPIFVLQQVGYGTALPCVNLLKGVQPLA